MFVVMCVVWCLDTDINVYLLAKSLWCNNPKKRTQVITTIATSHYSARIFAKTGFDEVSSVVLGSIQKYCSGSQCEVHRLSGGRGDGLPSQGAAHASQAFRQGRHFGLQPCLECALLSQLVCCCRQI